MVKNLPANVGDAGSIPGSGRSPGGRARQPTPVPLPGNPMVREAWQAIVLRVAKSQRQLKQLSTA